MTAPGRWHEIERVLHAALEVGQDRDAFVRHACGSDRELYREVHALLDAHEEVGALDRLAQGLFSSSAAASRDRDTMAGRTIGRYRVMDRLGGGGMGVVYEAHDVLLDRPAALKFLAPALSADADAKARFLIEAQSAAALDHPNICTIFDIGEFDDGQLFIAMPRYRGETLKARLGRGTIPIADAVTIALQIARGLTAAHDAGIVHRDVKPANVFLTSEGGVKLLDFGVAKLEDVSLTGYGARPGTVAYMSPEQARGDPVDSTTDIWSLGVVLYEMLTGERPFSGSHDQVVLRAILETEPTPVDVKRAEVPLSLAEVVHRALEKCPDRRYATARDLLRDLERAQLMHFPNGSAAPGAKSPADVRAPWLGAHTEGGVHPLGDRRLATIVVANLSGYAELLEAFAPADVERVLQQIRQAAHEVAVRHEGIINICNGEQIQLVFGVPITHEDDCRRAIRAALHLRARIGALGGPASAATSIALRLHTGIDTGQVITRPDGGGDAAYRIAGSVAQIAHALASLAAPDEVLVSPECHRITAPFFETLAEKPIALRDRPTPFVAHRVLGETALQTRLEAAEKAGLTPYVGRETELGVLRDCLDDLRRGHGRFVTVTGEAGMGKSRLLHEFHHALRDHGVLVLQGRCQSYGGGVAYLPFIDALRERLMLNDIPIVRQPEQLVAQIVAIAPELEEFVPLYLHLLSIPGSEEVAKHFQGEQFPMAMQEALAAILTLGARQRPTVLLLEDWHWVDQASHAALEYLVGMVPDYPLLVVVTCRPGLTMQWEPHGHHASILLLPMPAAASHAILKSVLHVAHFPEELSARLHERTGGNPFFLEEICHGLLEDGTLRVDGDAAVVAGTPDSIELPDTVHAVIRARLDRLDAGARDVVRIASVVGREFTRKLLEHTLEGTGSLPLALQALKAAGLIQQTHVVPDAAYRFKHSLTQEVAYGSLLEHQRKALHGRVGETIELLHTDHLEEDFERLAHHFSRAESWRKAVQYAIRCADRETALTQFSEALQMLERAQGWVARLPDDQARRSTYIEILLRQERLCETLGRRGRQQRIIDELIALLEPTGDRANLAEVYLRQGDVYTLLRRFDAAEGALEHSLHIRRDLGDAVGERNTIRSLGLLRWHEGRHAEALAHVEQALDIDRQRGDTVAIVEDVSNLGAVLRALGQHERGRMELEDALALLERSLASATDPRLARDLSDRLGYVLHNLANIHRELGNDEQALECLRRATVLTAEQRLRVKLSYHLTTIAHMALQVGNVDECLRNYREAVELTRKARFAPGLAQSLRFLGDVLLGLNRASDSLPHFMEAAELFSQLRDRGAEALMWSRVAKVHELESRFPESIGAWSKARSLAQGTGDQRAELAALEGLARVTRRHIDEPTLALEYYRDAIEIAVAIGDPVSEGRLRNALGIVEWNRGEYEEALMHYERARELYAEMADAGNLGLILNSIGVTLRDLGRRDDARRYLRDAIALHRRTGHSQLEAHALAVLGDVFAAEGDAAEALRSYGASLEIRQATRDRAGEGWMLHHLAQTQLGLGLVEEGRRLTVEARAIADAIGEAELRGACDQLQQRFAI